MNYRTRSATLMSLMTTLALVGCSDGPADPTDAAASLNISRRSPGIYVGSTPHRDSLKTGEQLQLLAAGLDRRGRLILPSAMGWSTNDSSRAVVSGRGLVTAMGNSGPVIISAASAGFVGRATLVIVGSSSAGPAPTDSTPVVTPPLVTPPVVTPPVVTPPVVTPPVITPPPAPSGAFTFCSSTNAVCSFSGTRQVRLLTNTGAFVVDTGTIDIPCAANYNGYFVNPPSASYVRCETGPVLTEIVPNAPGAGPTTYVVPIGAKGIGVPLFERNSDFGRSTPEDGSFRTVCKLAKFGTFDPVVFPGQTTAGHLHMFFGNTGITGTSTEQSLATSGNSTCLGGTLNRSAYWAPAMMDANNVPVTPESAIIYYKVGYNLDPRLTLPMPNGLRMIAGSKTAVGAQGVPADPSYIARWYCRSNGVDTPDGTLPVCQQNDSVHLVVVFPNCWDGVNLDSPDHKSHMAYPDFRNPPQRSSCPVSHPVQLPVVTQQFDYLVTPGQSSRGWHLSSDFTVSGQRAGQSAHADWMMAWDPATMVALVRSCINAQKDCGVGGLGNGTQLLGR